MQSVRDEGSSPANPYFTGLPTPAAAGLLLLPMLLSFQLGGDLFRNPVFSGAMIAVASSLMVSQLPTPSIKYMRPARAPVDRVGVRRALAGFMITWPWITLTIGMVIYLTSIPLGIAMQARQKARTRH